MSLINFPILYIPDPDKGRPLFNAKIYVGKPDLDPAVTINQKQLNIIQENGTVVPVSQPFSLSAGGVPVYNGKTVRLDVEGKYSIKILSKLGAQVYYIENVSPNVSVIDSLTLPFVFNELSDMIASTTVFTSEKLLEVSVNNTVSNKGFAQYRVRTAAQYAAESPTPTPDGALIGGILAGSDWYLNGSTDLVAQRIQVGPNINVHEFGYRGIGVINNGPTTKATPDATKDESDVLDKVFAYLERGAAQDIGASSAGVAEYIQKGAFSVTFPYRSICNISRPFPYFVNRCNISFNNTAVRPITPFVAWSSFGFNNKYSQLTIDYTAFNTPEDIYEAHLAGTDANGIEIMQFGHPTIAFPLETFTIYSQIIILGGWSGIKGARDGLLFGLEFHNCKMTNPLSWGIDLGSNVNISTTCTMSKPFVRLTERDTVQHNGFIWRALQHQGASEPDQEPPATAVSSEYWQIGLDGSGNPEVPSTQVAWVGSKFYRAFGKHYRCLNMSNLTMTNPSGDGGTDQSPIVEFSGINLDIDHYHLEKHQKVFSDRPTFSVVSGALTFGTLYLAECQITNEGNSTVQNGGEVFSCRVAHTSTADNEPLTGPNWFDFWDKISTTPVSEPAWVITSGYTTGDATFIKAANVGGRGISIDNLEQKSTQIKSGRVIALDGENTSEGRGYVGKGISESLTKNMGGQIAQRGFVKPKSNIIQVLSLTTVSTYRPRAEQNGSVFHVSLVEAGVFTAEIDGTLPQGTKFCFHVSETSGGVKNPAGTINLTGINNAFFTGPTTVKAGAIWVEKIGTATGSANSWRTWTEGVVDSDGWVEFIPIGSYTAGTFTLPLSKTLADVAEIKLTANVSIYYKTGYINLIDAGYSTGQFAVQENPVSNGTNSAQLVFSGPTSVSATIGTSGSSSPSLLSAYVKFK